MNDLAAVEIGKPIQYPFCNLAEHFLAYSSSKLFHLLVHAVQASPLTILHRDGYYAARGVSEGAVVLADMRCCDLPIEVQLAPDLFLHLWIWICRDNLEKS